MQPDNVTEIPMPAAGTEVPFTTYERCMILKNVIEGFPVKNFEDSNIRQSLYDAMRGDWDWYRMKVKESERDDPAPVRLTAADIRDLAETIKRVLDSGTALGDLSTVINPIYYRLESTRNGKE